MAVEIRKVKGLRDLRQFIGFPVHLYWNEPNYVPAPRLDEIRTLRKDKNPAFEHCEAEYWTAWKDGRLVGRIAGIINHRYIENGAISGLASGGSILSTMLKSPKSC